MARDRPGSKRMSFHRRSTSSVPRVEAFETSEEKHRMQVKGKADPSRAMVEAEPVAVANSEVTLGKPLRDMEHRDQEGNIIVDPDRSNPTRPRLERPLDTIRSFEAAIDGSYYRRQSYRTETPNASSVAQTRRTSYMSSHQPLQRRGPNEGGGHYNERNHPNRPESYHENAHNAPGSYYGNSTSRRHPPRNNSEPVLYGSSQMTNQPQQAFYPSHGHQQSYDTVGGVSNGSHVTEPWGNSTDPSSENSSIDRMHQQQPKPDAGEAYGFNGFGANPQLSGPILEEYGHANGGTHHLPQQDQYYSNMDGAPQYQPHGPPVPQHGSAAPPPPPPKEDRNRLRSNAAGYGGRGGGSSAPSRPSQPEKRKSWLKRFSKS